MVSASGRPGNMLYEYDHDGNLASLLPGSVLEYILTFLPDQSVASMSSACRLWHSEIGKNSPGLWKYLLQRQKWPPPRAIDLLPGPESSKARDIYRREFLTHYAVVREVQGILRGLSAVSDPTRPTGNEFSLSPYPKTGVSQKKSIIDVKIVSPGEVLVACAIDCTIRHLRVGKGRECIELGCRRISSTEMTFVAMDIDDSMIGCLLYSFEGYSFEWNLVTIRKTDFLRAETKEEIDYLDDGKVQTISIRRAVLAYLISCDENNPLVEGVRSFLERGVALSRVRVNVSRHILACGQGRFLIEASILFPTNDSDVEMELPGSRLVLFNAITGSVEWMRDSDPLGQVESEDQELAGICLEGGIYSVAVLSQEPPMLLTAEIGEEAPDTRYLDLRKFTQHTGTDDQSEDYYAAMTLTPSDIVLAANIYNATSRQYLENKLLFLPRAEPGSVETLALTLSGNGEVFRMTLIRNEYLVVLCTVFKSKEANDDEITGDWFGPDTSEQLAHQIAIIVHVPTRTEIHRVCLTDESISSTLKASLINRRIMIAAKDNTLAAVIDPVVIFTGEDVRSGVA